MGIVVIVLCMNSRDVLITINPESRRSDFIRTKKKPREAEIDAAVRVLYDELGVEVTRDDIHFLRYETASGKMLKQPTVNYITVVDMSEPFDLPPNYSWFPLINVSDLLCSHDYGRSAVYLNEAMDYMEVLNGGK